MRAEHERTGLTNETGSDLLGGGVDTEDIEHAAIGALILASDSTRSSILSVLADEDICEPRARFLLTTVRTMVGNDVPVDQLTVAAYVNSHALLAQGAPRMGIATTLHDMCGSAPVPVAGPWYAALTVEAAARRRIGDTGRELQRISAAGAISDLRTVVIAELGAVLDILERAEAAVRSYA